MTFAEQLFDKANSLYVSPLFFVPVDYTISGGQKPRGLR